MTYKYTLFLIKAQGIRIYNYINKAAAARARKATLELEKLGKQFRKESIAEL